MSGMAVIDRAHQVGLEPQAEELAAQRLAAGGGEEGVDVGQLALVEAARDDAGDAVAQARLDAPPKSA